MQHTAHLHSHPHPHGSSHGRGHNLHTEGFAHPHTNIQILGVQHGMKVADFGAGSGAYTFAIAEQLANSGHIYAIDVQKDLLKRLHNEAVRLGYKNVSVIWDDLERQHASKIADHHLDLVLISNMLFQVEDKAAVIQEAKRVLKMGGRLAIIDWSESYGGMGPHKDHVVTKAEATKVAEECGFKLVNDFSAGAHHYGLMLQPSHRITVKNHI